MAQNGSIEKLLNFSEPIDVPLLDATVNAFYGGNNEEVCKFYSRRDACALPTTFFPLSHRASSGSSLFFLLTHSPLFFFPNNNCSALQQR